MRSCYVEIDYFQHFKTGKMVCGDTFMSRKIKKQDRSISILSDGLGSGVKANVLSTLTATMALNYSEHHFDIQKTAGIIMKTLPVCKVRRISYATFTIVEIESSGKTHVVEYDNPPYCLIRNERIIKPKREKIAIIDQNDEEKFLSYSTFTGQLGDRMVLFSDGISQSAMGTPMYPFGWGEERAYDYALRTIQRQPEISARNLANVMVKKAYEKSNYEAKDDISAGVFYFRNPRKLMLVSGPPINPANDKKMAYILSEFQGKKAVSGGTTANIISRELDQPISVDMSSYDRQIPPISIMDGIDLVTEGTITLGKVIEILEKGVRQDFNPGNGAERLVNMMMNSDIIHFLVGTKINDAHQDPNIPVELDIRRNIFKRIERHMRETYMKETKIEFI